MLDSVANYAGKRRSQAGTSPNCALTPTDHDSNQASVQTQQLSRVSHQGICMHPSQRHSVTAAANFQSYMRTPLPADQKLLTLLHFNLVRGLTCNMFLLGLDPDAMNDDIASPFETSAIRLDSLPPTLHPTYLQKTIPHHPEVDLFPFPRYRDNFIRAGDAIDDTEICLDMLYGVELDLNLNPISRLPVKDCKDIGLGGGGRTGLIVWSDPWLQSSWEVEEGFARKYRKLFAGCDDLIRSTNFWRNERGESPLVVELDD